MVLTTITETVYTGVDLDKVTIKASYDIEKEFVLERDGTYTSVFPKNPNKLIKSLIRRWISIDNLEIGTTDLIFELYVAKPTNDINVKGPMVKFAVRESMKKKYIMEIIPPFQIVDLDHHVQYCMPLGEFFIRRGEEMIFSSASFRVDVTVSSNTELVSPNTESYEEVLSSDKSDIVSQCRII